MPGLAALVYRGITYTSRETIIDLGPLYTTTDRQKMLPLHRGWRLRRWPGGVVLLIAAVREHT